MKNVLRVITAISFVAISLFATSCDDSDTPPEVDTSIDIITATIASNPLVVKQPVITEKEGRSEIVFYVSAEAKKSELKFALNFEIPSVCTISPASGTVVDFSQGTVPYTVNNELAKLTKVYDVKCVREKYKDALITSISISSFDKIVTQPELTTDGNYEFIVKAESTVAELSALVPTIEVSVGATISPASDVAQNFNTPVVYTVTSENGESNTYTVTCIRQAYTSAQILSVSSSDPLVEVQPTITETSIKLHFSADATDAQVAASMLTCVLSDGATLATSPLVVDTAVEYVVTAEDGVTKTIYNVTAGRYNKIMYSFEEWRYIKANGKAPEYYDPTGEGWGTANEAVVLIYNFGDVTGGGTYSVERSSDPYSGTYAMDLVTLQTEGTFIPAKITSGSAFLGTFATNLENPLLSTNFGIEFHEKPLVVSGYYKYKAGPIFYKNNTTPVEDKFDAMAMTAVLYEVNDYAETLTGADMAETTANVVAWAYLTDGAEKTEYTPFKLTLEYGKNGNTYDPTKMYKFAIVLSSSVEGDKYFGAPGSKLTVDDIAVIY